MIRGNIYYCQLVTNIITLMSRVILCHFKISYFFLFFGLFFFAIVDKEGELVCYCYWSSVDVYIKKKKSKIWSVFSNKRKGKVCVLSTTIIPDERSVCEHSSVFIFCDDSCLNCCNRGKKKVLCVSLIWFRFKWKPDLFPTHNNMNSQEQKLESPTSDGAMLAYWWVNDSKNDKLSNTIWNILVALILYYLLNVITASRIKGIYKKTNTVTNTPRLLTDFVRDICRLLSKNS